MSGVPPIEPDTLAGEVAIVTGGGRGIGRAIACELAAAGASVAVTARSASEVEETVRLIADGAGSAIGIPCDVADLAAVERLVSDVTRDLGPVSLLVNNAATLAGIGPLWETDPLLWRQDIEVTLFGTFNCTRAVLPQMLARGRGRIVNISSMNAVWGLLYTSAYDCAKTAQLRLTEGLAGEVAGHGISVFAVAPGPVRTRMSEASADPAVAHWMSNRGFVFDIDHDPIEPERAGRLVVHLASGFADGLTGRFITVQDDLGELAESAEAIRDDELLALRIDSLHGRIRNGHRPASHRQSSA